MDIDAATPRLNDVDIDDIALQLSYMNCTLILALEAGDTNWRGAVGLVLRALERLRDDLTQNAARSAVTSNCHA